MRKLLFLAPLLLVGCSDPIPCMGPVEKGEVVRAESSVQEFCGRNGCTMYSTTYLNIRVNGVGRTCIVSDATAKMFAPGDTINLQTGKRL